MRKVEIYKICGGMINHNPKCSTDLCNSDYSDQVHEVGPHDIMTQINSQLA